MSIQTSFLLNSGLIHTQYFSSPRQNLFPTCVCFLFCSLPTTSFLSPYLAGHLFLKGWGQPRLLVAFPAALKRLANCSFISVPINTLRPSLVHCELFLSISGELVLPFRRLKLSIVEHWVETQQNKYMDIFPKNKKCSFLCFAHGWSRIPEHNRCAVNVAWVIQLLEPSYAVNFDCSQS